jgi:hypothetical protein
LSGVTVRQIQDQTGHSTNTVQRVWSEYLRASAVDRREEVEARREELILRHERIADRARVEAAKFRRVVNRDGVVTDEGNPSAYARLLREERDALREVARLTGADAPVRVEHSGSVGVDLSPDREALFHRLMSLAGSVN